MVYATGKDTFFGRAATLMNIDAPQGRFQQILFRITMALLVMCLVICAIIYVKLIVSHQDALASLSIVVVILVASIPVAIEVVCTSTMAVGSRRLSQKKVIVARLSAIEEVRVYACMGRGGGAYVPHSSLACPFCARTRRAR